MIDLLLKVIGISFLYYSIGAVVMVMIAIIDRFYVNSDRYEFSIHEDEFNSMMHWPGALIVVFVALIFEVIKFIKRKI